LKPGSDAIKAACITVLGSGYGPVAPGTWGSLAATVVFAAVWWIGIAVSTPEWATSVIVVLLGIAAASWISVLWGEWAVAYYRSKDPKPFVLDEFAGQWVALLWLPPVAMAGWWEFGWVVGGQFILFRVFDILKPPPARQVERWPAGWGILCDDLISGAYANVVGQLVWRLSPAAVWLGLSNASV
jgi:phosphatidylglycerophosphatase A